MPAMEPQEDLLAKAKRAIGLGLGDIATAHSTASGTFNAAGAFGFGAGGVQEAIRDNTKRTADSVEKAEKWVREMSQKAGGEFTS